MCVQSCPTLGDTMDCNQPGSSVHGIFQARKLKWVAVSHSRDLPDPGIKPMSLTFLTLAGRFFTIALPGKLNSLMKILVTESSDRTGSRCSVMSSQMIPSFPGIFSAWVASISSSWRINREFYPLVVPKRRNYWPVLDHLPSSGPCIVGGRTDFADCPGLS